jgi:hypothetical protein
VRTVAYFTAAHLLSAAIVILLAVGLYQVLGHRLFAKRVEAADTAEPKLDSGFKLLTKLVGVWIAFGALVIIILVPQPRLRAVRLP